MTNQDLHLKETPTLPDFQQYLKDMVEARGFGNKDSAALFLCFTEECGELAKAIRKAEGMSIDHSSKVRHVSEELADVFIYLLEISNHYGIDLEHAFREKEEANKKRTWQ